MGGFVISRESLTLRSPEKLQRIRQPITSLVKHKDALRRYHKSRKNMKGND